ncbi:hypothetical protein [Desulfoscipio geothermicus]|uniref:Uncharacterized protein n=1 Tax=Desulfoscipio geothermicus DSM 3669 TaxID=1121426 RepID=A0A1I6D4T3_9FIRM|nr:hypothetical protein [Desulfoscipio geothermicus]SFR00509.1 hypothetical protein SAMN05660706_105122 [Desulfoscipio geothermicus DSM 3669]
MPNKRTNKPRSYGVTGDYMTAGIEDLNIEPKTPHRLPGRENPPKPWDDRKGAGMSLGELVKEKVADMIDKK